MNDWTVPLAGQSMAQSTAEPSVTVAFYSMADVGIPTWRDFLSVDYPVGSNINGGYADNSLASMALKSRDLLLINNPINQNIYNFLINHRSVSNWEDLFVCIHLSGNIAAECFGSPSLACSIWSFPVWRASLTFTSVEAILPMAMLMIEPRGWSSRFR